MEMCNIINVDNDGFIHLNLFKRAVKRVSDQYIKSDDLEYHPGVKLYVSLAERVFAYELYRQWANLLEGNEMGLVLNGETRKDFVGSFIEAFRKKKRNSIRHDDSGYFYPDLVLHDKNVQESKCNMIVCEIKRYENISGTLDDLKKIELFLSDELQPKMEGKVWNSYHYGIFLLIGPKCKNNEPINLLKELKKQLEKTTEINQEKQKRIYCCTSNGNKEDLQFESLYNLLN